MSNNELKETIGNEPILVWLDRANNSVRKSIAVFETILNECPDKKSNEFHRLNAVLLGRKVGALMDVASWFDGIDVEEIRKQNADIFNLKVADNSLNN